MSTIRSSNSFLPSVKTAWKNWGRTVLLTSVILSGALVGIRALGGFQGMELAMYDRLLRWRAADEPDPRLLVIGIDETDIQTRQEWPLRDRTLLTLLEEIETYEPRVIGLDIFRDVPIGNDEASREALLNYLQTSDRIITVCKASSSDGAGTPPPPGIEPGFVGFADLPVDPGGTLRRALLWMSPPPIPEAAADAPSHLCNQPGTLFSLNFQLASFYLETEGYAIDLDPQGNLRFNDTILPPISPNEGGYVRADTSGYQLLINYRANENAIEQVSLRDVLDGNLDPELVRDRIVLIGYLTPEAKDDFYTPYSAGLQDSQKMQGVIVHAQIVSQIISTVLDDRPLLWSWPTGVEVAWIFAWSVAGGVLGWHIRRPIRYAIAMIASSGAVVGIGFLIMTQSGWIPLVPPVVALLLTSSGVVMVDRFNNSDYGRKVYRQVKTLLRIDIDKSKVEREVSEITQTEYFSELQQKARDLRDRRKSGNTGISKITKTSSSSTSESTAPISEAQSEDHSSNAGNRADSSASHSQESRSANANLDDLITKPPQRSDTDDFFSQLQQKAQQVKRSPRQSSSDSNHPESDVEPSPESDTNDHPSE